MGEERGYHSLPFVGGDGRIGFRGGPLESRARWLLAMGTASRSLATMRRLRHAHVWHVRAKGPDVRARGETSHGAAEIITTGYQKHVHHWLLHGSGCLTQTPVPTSSTVCAMRDALFCSYHSSTSTKETTIIT